MIETRCHSLCWPGTLPGGSSCASGTGAAVNDVSSAEFCCSRSVLRLNCHGERSVKQQMAKVNTTAVRASHPGRSRNRNRTPPR